MEKYFKSKSRKDKNLTTKELQAIRLLNLKNFMKSRRGKEYYSISDMRQVLIKIDKEELASIYQNKDIGKPTHRQVFEIHHQVFKGSKNQVTEKILEDYFLREGVTIDNFSNGRHIVQLNRILKEQGIELAHDTIRRKIKAYQNELNNIEIRSDFKKQRTEYRNLINRIKQSHRSGKLEDLEYIQTTIKLLANLDKLGSQTFGQIKAKEEAFGVSEEDLPKF